MNHGLRYWSTASDFSTLYNVWLLWDQKTDRPRDEKKLQQALVQLDQQNRMLDRFTCANLVWRAFLRGTNGRLDIASGYSPRIGGRFAGVFSDAFLSRVMPYVITADAFYFAGNFARVPQP